VPHQIIWMPTRGRHGGRRPVARRYRGSTVERVELLHQGVVGLMRACRRFDPDLGTPFWACATWWVRQAMQQLVASQTGPTVLSDRALRGLGRVKEARRASLQEHGREPTVDELGEMTGLAREQIGSLLVAERAPPQLVLLFAHCRAMATRSRSSGVMRWSASSASSARSICTQLTVPVKTLLSPS
jgi:hypothetical protein